MYHHKFYRTDNSSLMIAAATHDLNCERRCAYQSFLGRKIFRCVAFKMSQYSQSILLLSLHFSYLHSRRLREHSGCIVLKVNVLRHVIHSLDIWAYKLSLKFYFIQVSIAVVRGDNWTPISYWVLDRRTSFWFEVHVVVLYLFQNPVMIVMSMPYVYGTIFIFRDCWHEWRRYLIFHRLRQASGAWTSTNRYVFHSGAWKNQI